MFQSQTIDPAFAAGLRASVRFAFFTGIDQSGISRSSVATERNAARFVGSRRRFRALALVGSHNVVLYLQRIRAKPVQCRRQAKFGWCCGARLGATATISGSTQESAIERDDGVGHSDRRRWVACETPISDAAWDPRWAWEVRLPVILDAELAQYVSGWERERRQQRVVGRAWADDAPSEFEVLFVPPHVILACT